MSERKLDKDLEEEIGFMISSHLGDIYDELRITSILLDGLVAELQRTRRIGPDWIERLSWDNLSTNAGRLPLLSNRVAAFGNGSTIVVDDGPGSGKADSGVRPQTHVPAPSIDYDSLDPRFAAGRGDVQV